MPNLRQTGVFIKHDIDNSAPLVEKASDEEQGMIAQPVVRDSGIVSEENDDVVVRDDGSSNDDNGVNSSFDHFGSQMSSDEFNALLHGPSDYDEEFKDFISGDNSDGQDDVNVGAVSDEQGGLDSQHVLNGGFSSGSDLVVDESVERGITGGANDDAEFGSVEQDYGFDGQQGFVSQGGSERARIERKRDVKSKNRRGVSNDVSYADTNMNREIPDRRYGRYNNSQAIHRARSKEVADACVGVVKKFPRPVLQEIASLFPSARNQTDALVAYLATHSDDKIALIVSQYLTESQLKLVSSWKTDSSADVLYRLDNLRAMLKDFNDDLSVVKMLSCYNIFDRLGFRHMNPTVPEDIKFMEDGMLAVAKQAESQTKKFVDEMDHHFGFLEHNRNSDYVEK